MTKFLVDAVDRLLTLDVEQVVDVLLNASLGFLEFGEVSAETGNSDLVAEVVLNRVGKYEVTISQALHLSLIHI